MKRYTIALSIIIVFVLVLPQHFSCNKIDLKREVLLRTGSTEDITYNSAKLLGTIVDAGEDNSFSEYGFVLSSTGTPTINDTKLIAGTSWKSGAYFANISGLSGNTDYYYRSYVRADYGDVYGNINQFTTEVSPNATPPTVITLSVNNIAENSATAHGNVTEDGGATIDRRGFCISTDPMPNIDDDLFSENDSGLGEYQNFFTNLEPETEYYVRAYAENQMGIAYGDQVSFTTTQGGEPVNEWLHYDDGENYDGIGLVEDGNFDVVIRFTPQELAAYAGMAITKFRIYVLEDLSIDYYVEIFEGEQPTINDLVYEQLVETPSATDWTEVTLEEPYYIDPSQEIWVGYYVSGSVAGLYPAGIDNGPAEAGYGDIIGTGNPIQWGLLTNGGIDGNWNIQIFVTTEAGEEVQMTREQPAKPTRKTEKGSPASFQSLNQSAQ